MTEQIEMFEKNDVLAEAFGSGEESPTMAVGIQPQLRRVVTIRHNGEYSADTVEVLDGTTQLCMDTDGELNPTRLAEILRWFGHTVRVVDYMFPHDIAEFG
jgi:hypothetical protein